MPNINELLAKENVNAALAHFASRRDGSGPNGMRISELASFWKSNHGRIERQVRESSYQFGIVKPFQVLGPNGKRRTLSSIDVIDRFVERLLQQVLDRYFEPMFMPKSFAYQRGKGTLDAATLARSYISSGNSFLCEVDIKDYFDWIPHKRLMGILADHISDSAVLSLLRGCIERHVEREGRIVQMRRGILQGGPVSPLLSNIYLHSLDVMMDADGWSWFRFADNIGVYTPDRDSASEIYECLSTVLTNNYRLRINSRKSGVYRALDRRVLGFDLYMCNGSIDIRRHQYQRSGAYSKWHESAIAETPAPGEYHIVEDGILNRKDYTLLFENEEEKHYIPVEVIDQLNIYGNITVAPPVLNTLGRYGIRLAYFDKHGMLMGTYTPAGHQRSSAAFLAQCELYCNKERRVQIARQMVIASMHNMRSNLRYYFKKTKDPCLETAAKGLSARITEANECMDVDSLMLVEARARRGYYEQFGRILERSDFTFAKRTRRPPKDATNAMISFGNTLLYNRFLKIIWKTSLDPRIGVVHATGRRSHSLDLDFADIFKPVVIDRVIFSLANRREIKASAHFTTTDKGGVLLNPEGKRIFIKAFEDKLASCHGEGAQRVSYGQLLMRDVRSFQSLLMEGVKYKPYKYQ